MKKFISFSGGVESTTMCILYGATANGIWCDTGSEHEKMYERMNTVQDSIRKIHPNFEIINIIPEVTAHNKKVKTLEEYCIEMEMLPSGQKRFCTNRFKIIPIDKFLQTQGECELMIGLNFDEADREGNMEKMQNVTYTYPLLEEGLTRADCKEILSKYSLLPNFPVYMNRGGCRMCFFKSEREYKALYHLNKAEYMEVMAFEKSVQGRKKKFFSIMGNFKSLEELAVECEREKAFFINQDWEEIYKPVKQETSCGYFCHR